MITVYPVGDTTLDEIVNERLSDPNSILIESNKTILAANPARMILYLHTFEVQPYDLKVMEIFIVNGDTKYEISYFAEATKYDNYLPTIQKMINSFEIIDFLPYENLNYGVKIQYPSNWEKTEENNNEMRFSSPLESN